MSWWKYLIRVSALAGYLWDSVGSATPAPPPLSTLGPDQHLLIYQEKWVWRIGVRGSLMCKETKQSGICLIFRCCENTVYSVSVYFYSISLHISFFFLFFWTNIGLYFLHSWRRLGNRNSWFLLRWAYIFNICCAGCETRSLIQHGVT